MARVLVAWELGANFGHLGRLIPIALRLREHGHQVLFAVRNLRHAHDLLTANALPFIGAPTVPVDGSLPMSRQPCSYAGILALQGMADRNLLLPQVDAWKTIFKLFRADAVILDHAPVAMFSALLAGLPRMAVGTGFELPPLTAPFPIFRTSSPVMQAHVVRQEANILAVLNKLLIEHDAPMLAECAGMFTETARCFATLPELDHYEQRSTVEYLGLLPTVDARAGNSHLEWPSGKKRIFLYLQRNYLHLQAMIEELDNRGYSVIACIPGGQFGKNALGKNAFQRAVVFPTWINTQSVLPKADLVVSHGGHGLAAESLLHGVPSLMLPQHLEQSMLARQISRLEAGSFMHPGHTLQEVMQSLESVLANPTFADRASDFKKRYMSHCSQSVLEKVILAVEGLLRR